jgi:hypothetical protein
MKSLGTPCYFSLDELCHFVYVRYSFDRSRIDPAYASNFIGFQVLNDARTSYVNQSNLAVEFMYFLLQFWGFIGTCVFVLALFLHPFFFIIGLLGTFPFILTQYIWPVARNILLGFLAVKLVTVVFDVFLSPLLVQLFNRFWLFPVTCLSSEP